MDAVRNALCGGRGGCEFKRLCRQRPNQAATAVGDQGRISPGVRAAGLHRTRAALQEICVALRPAAQLSRVRLRQHRSREYLTDMVGRAQLHPVMAPCVWSGVWHFSF
jgi:hypothetical protein